MRIFLVLAGLLSLAVVGLLSVGIIRITQANTGVWPTVSFDVKKGRLPSFKAEAPSIAVTTVNTMIAVPPLEVVPAGESAEGDVPAAHPAN